MGVAAGMRLRHVWGSGTVLCMLAAAALAQDVVLTPKRVMEFALGSNAAVLGARYEVAQEGLGIEAAAARFKPVLKLRVSYAHLGDPPTVTLPDLGPAAALMPSEIETSPQDILSVGYTVTQPVFTAGRLLNTYRAARRRHESASMAAERTRQEVRLAALKLFWAYVAAQQGLRPLEETVAWLEQLSKDVTALVEAGVLVEDEKLRMKTQKALAELALLRARDSLAQAGDQLLLFCNLSPHNRIVIDTLVLAALQHDTAAPEHDVEDVVRQRSDVRALELQIASLQAVRRGLRSASWPSIAGVFAHDIKNQDPADPGRFESVWSVGASMEWTLLDWGAARVERAKADTAAAQLRLALDNRRRAIRIEIAAARRRIDESLAAERLALESVDNAQRALRNVDTRYRGGLATGSDLLNSRRELTQAQQELVGARIRKALALEAYRTAVGE